MTQVLSASDKGAALAFAPYSLCNSTMSVHAHPWLDKTNIYLYLEPCADFIVSATAHGRSPVNFGQRRPKMTH